MVEPTRTGRQPPPSPRTAAVREPQVGVLPLDEVRRDQVRRPALPGRPRPGHLRRAVRVPHAQLRQERGLRTPLVTSAQRPHLPAPPAVAQQRADLGRAVRARPRREQPGHVVRLHLQPRVVLGEPRRQLQVADPHPAEEHLVKPVRGGVQPGADDRNVRSHGKRAAQRVGGPPPGRRHRVQVRVRRNPLRDAGPVRRREQSRLHGQRFRPGTFPEIGPHRDPHGDALRRPERREGPRHEHAVRAVDPPAVVPVPVPASENAVTGNAVTGNAAARNAAARSPQPVRRLPGRAGWQQPRQPGPPLPDAERLPEVFGSQPGRRGVLFLIPNGLRFHRHRRASSSCGASPSAGTRDSRHSGSSATSRKAQPN